jgi:DNA (cytosine-5)-methyltransferase 1
MIIANINPSGNGINGAVHTVDAEAPTITTNKGEGNKIIVAMRGRNPDNPSDRTVGSPTEQRLEPNSQGICNTLTSVQKDNLVMETVRIKQATSQGYIECEVGGVADLSFPESNTRRGRVQEKGQVSPTIMAGEQDICRIEKNDNFYLSDKGKKFVCDPKRGMCTDINPDVCITLTAKGQANWTGSFVSPDIDYLEKSKTIGSTEPTLIHLKDGTTITSNDSLAQYRIRKLTPLECWRLMDFTDEDFEKAAEVNSNTQLYKQAGNSIIRNVLVAILGQMIPGKEDVYKNI